MTLQITRWFEYGEPVADDRVAVMVRTAYMTGPNEESRPDEVKSGTIPVENLALLDEESYSEHVHSDGSLILSALSDSEEDALLSGFEPDNTEGSE